jgi:hypothetical protein
MHAYRETDELYLHPSSLPPATCLVLAVYEPGIDESPPPQLPLR